MRNPFKREKRWQMVALAAEQAFVSVVIADFGYLGYGFAYAHDLTSGETVKVKAYAPFAAGVQVATAPDEGLSRLVSPGRRMSYDAAAGRLQLSSSSLQLDLRIERGQPFDAGWRIPGAGEHRTRKRMGDPGAGTLVIGKRALELRGHGLFDWSQGHLARETAWRWAAGVGSAGGRRIGWNLRTGFDDPTQAENACWIDGAPQPLGPATIEPGAPWIVRAGPLELRFEGDGAHQENLNVGLIASRYQQPWGRFSGTWDGAPLRGYGVVEDHWARW